MVEAGAAVVVEDVAVVVETIAGAAVVVAGAAVVVEDVAVVVETIAGAAVVILDVGTRTALSFFLTNHRTFFAPSIPPRPCF